MPDPVLRGRQSHTDGTIRVPCRGARHRVPHAPAARSATTHGLVTAGCPAGWRGVFLIDGAQRGRNRLKAAGYCFGEEDGSGDGVVRGQDEPVHSSMGTLPYVSSMLGGVKSLQSMRFLGVCLVVGREAEDDRVCHAAATATASTRV
jgi:hypothetical protein